MNEQGRNEADISRYTDVEYSPEGYKTVYRWGDFLEIAGGHVHNAMDTIDLVLAGGEYEGFNPRYAYTCEFVGCSTLIDGIALFRPVSRDGEDLTQIAFLRSDIDDDTGAYTERFEAGSFDIAAASDIQCSDLGIDLLDYFRGRSFEGLSGVKRGLDGREAVVAVEVATGCDLDLFEDFWLGLGCKSRPAICQEFAFVCEAGWDQYGCGPRRFPARVVMLSLFCRLFFTVGRTTRVAAK